MNQGHDEPGTEVPFPYDGPPELLQPITEALRRVVDPEVAASIVDLGLVYGVRFGEEQVQVLLTMTSAACPVADVILDEVEAELDRVLPAQLQVQLQLVWDPPWTPERMSAQAKSFMGW